MESQPSGHRRKCRPNSQPQLRALPAGGVTGCARHSVCGDNRGARQRNRRAGHCPPGHVVQLQPGGELKVGEPGRRHAAQRRCGGGVQQQLWPGYRHPGVQVRHRRMVGSSGYRACPRVRRPGHVVRVLVGQRQEPDARRRRCECRGLSRPSGGDQRLRRGQQRPGDHLFAHWSRAVGLRPVERSRRLDEPLSGQWPVGADRRRLIQQLWAHQRRDCRGVGRGGAHSQRQSLFELARREAHIGPDRAEERSRPSRLGRRRPALRLVQWPVQLQPDVRVRGGRRFGGGQCRAELAAAACAGEQHGQVGWTRGLRLLPPVQLLSTQPAGADL